MKFAPIGWALAASCRKVMVQMNSTDRDFSHPTEKKTLHFDLSHIGHHEDMMVHANLRDYALKKHDDASLRKAIEEMPFLRLIPRDRLTHYIEDLPVPVGRPSLITASIPGRANGQPVRIPVAMHVHIPQQSIDATRADRKAIFGERAVHPKLLHYGVGLGASSEALADPLPDPLDPQNGLNNTSDTAAALLFHHNSLTHLQPDVASNVLSVCNNNAWDLANAITEQGANWLNVEPVVDRNGQPMRDDAGNPLQTAKLSLLTQRSAQGCICAAVRQSRDTSSLEDHLWSIQYGTGASSYGATPSGGFEEQADDGTPWRLKYTSGEHGLSVGNLRWDQGGRTVDVDFTNYWNRHLGVYVQFIGSDGNAIAPAWTDRLDPSLRQTFEPDSTKKYVALVDPIGEVCGIPLPATPTTLSFQVPDEAASFILHAGGLGTGNFDKSVCFPGLLFTALTEFSIPMTLLVAGAALDEASDFTSLFKNTETLNSILSFFTTIAMTTGDAVQASGNVKDVLLAIAQDLGPVLLQAAVAKALAKLLTKAALEKAIPYVDIVFQVYAAAVDASLLAQTTIEVAMSPFVYKSEFTRKVDLNVTITYDKSNSASLPPQATHYKVWAIYDSKATVAAQEFPMPGAPLPDSLTVQFKGLPAGGKLKVFTAFYSSDDWVAGQGQTEWIDTVTAGSSIAASITIQRNKVSLTNATTYSQFQKLVYDGGYQWAEAPIPTTVPFEQGAIAGANGITLAQAPECIGYTWQGTSRSFLAQNVSLTRVPGSAYGVSSAHVSKVGICYDFSSSANDGNNFLIDDSSQVRKIGLTLSSCAGIPSSGDSYGSFPYPLLDSVVHPQGYIFGITGGDMGKIYRCEIGPNSKCTFLSGQGRRVGLLDDPRAIDVGLEGVLLVLEAGNCRIQAFDVCGNPVKYFNGSCFLPIPGGRTYLDMAVEAKGYIYLLSCADANNASSYQMSVYTPSGSLLFTANQITAGKITIDLWRSVYALNYEPIPGRDEPSVSMWIPSAP